MNISEKYVHYIYLLKEKTEFCCSFPILNTNNVHNGRQI